MTRIIVISIALAVAASSSAQSAGALDGNYYTVPQAECTSVDNDGFIRRWMVLEPIEKPNRSNTVFTDSYLRENFGKEYFEGQMTIEPCDGQTVETDSAMLKWHEIESTGYNVHLYRFARKHDKPVYGVIFWAATVIESPEDMEVRLSVGSNSASMWWLNGEEVLIMSGDRRMVADDAMSKRINLKKGRNVLRGVVINGPGMSSFCARFVTAEGVPITNLSSCRFK